MPREPNLIERLGIALAGDYIREAAGEFIDPDDHLYRRLTDAGRDLAPYEIDRAQSVALYLYQRNPMAKRLTDLLVDFVIGADGLSFEAEDDAVKEVIDEFWNDPRSNWVVRHRDLVRDLSLMGEIALRRAVNPESGRSRLGVLDVARIKDVLPDPDDMLVDTTLVLTKPNHDDEYLDLVVWDDTTDPANPRWVGDAFYFAINRVVGQHRGVPDLFSIADHVDGYDQILFNARERSALINAFVYDVTLTGANPTDIALWERGNREPPRPGSVRVHNEKELWQAVAPNMSAEDVTRVGRAVKNMALGGAGVPEAWYAEGDSANRATLTAQGDPTYRMLQSRQEFIADIFSRMLSVVVQEQVGRGRIGAGTDTSFVVRMPELSARDTASISSAMPQVVNALAAAVDSEFIDTATARRLVLTVAEQLGVDIDEQEVVDAIEEQRAEREEKAAEEAAAAYRRAMLARTAPDAEERPESPVPPPGGVPGQPEPEPRS